MGSHQILSGHRNLLVLLPFCAFVRVNGLGMRFFLLGRGLYGTSSACSGHGGFRMTLNPNIQFVSTCLTN